MKIWPVAMGVGMAAGAVTAMMLPKHSKARQLLLDNREKLEELSLYLYEKETISGEEFMKILNNGLDKQ